MAGSNLRQAQLAIELQALVDLDFDVEITGFSLAEVDIVLDEAREPERQCGVIQCLARVGTTRTS
jgi:hypothetical protein